MGASLARQLRVGTADAHKDAERAGIMREFLDGKMARRPYCALLRNLHPIYQMLEQALERHAAHVWIAPVFSPELRRTQTLEADLHALHGPHWAETFVVEAACAKYLDRLAHLDQHQPELLIAHAYLRYLGDLSGGQILCRLAEKALRLTSGIGTAFYRFEGPDSVTELAQRFRGGLDAAPIPENGRNAIVTEANLAFRLHVGLFEELAARFSADRQPQPGQSPG